MYSAVLASYNLPSKCTIVDMLALSARSQFRRYDLDGAAVFFQPSTGTHVRIQNASTRRLRRQAPRAVMFGITNACNLACSFCSRDTALSSKWTVESASEMLEGLHRQGVLEVAFGGGEPFAFAGFVELIERLYETTCLALNVTTNGLLLTERKLARLCGKIGIVRVSLYDTTPYRDIAERLNRHGMGWGANLIVTPRLLEDLPALLQELEQLGCHDVSLLNYVGDDLRLHLSQAQEAVLASVIDNSLLPVRVSVCFGNRLGVARLFDGPSGTGDCGAGDDFISILPDKTVSGCSFAGQGPAASRADTLLTHWKMGRNLRKAVAKQGCARPYHPSSACGLEGLRVWQGYSGNNSGECVMVAHFDDEAKAEEYLHKLVPGYDPEQDGAAPWRELFKDSPYAKGQYWDEDVSIDRVGATVLASTYGADDEFEDMRALVWKSQGRLVPGGIHEHEQVQLVCSVKVVSRELAQEGLEAASCVSYGDWLLIWAQADESIEEQIGKWQALLGDAGSMHKAELYWHKIDLGLVNRQLPQVKLVAAAPRWVVYFWDEEAANKYCRRYLDGRQTGWSTGALIEPAGRSNRLAVVAAKAGGRADLLSDPVVTTCASFEAGTRGKNGKLDPLDLDVIRRGLSVRQLARIEVKEQWNRAVGCKTDSDEPAKLIANYMSLAREHNLRLRVGLSDSRPLLWLLTRLTS